MPRSGEGTREQTSTGSAQMWMRRLVAESSGSFQAFVRHSGRAAIAARAGIHIRGPSYRFRVRGLSPAPRNDASELCRLLFAAGDEPVLQRRSFALILDAD